MAFQAEMRVLADKATAVEGEMATEMTASLSKEEEKELESLGVEQEKANAVHKKAGTCREGVVVAAVCVCVCFSVRGN